MTRQAFKQLAALLAICVTSVTAVAEYNKRNTRTDYEIPINPNEPTLWSHDEWFLDNFHSSPYYIGRFKEHIDKFKIVLRDDFDFKRRAKIFANNLDDIEHHNRYSGSTVILAANRFAHLNFHEFRDELGMLYGGCTRRPQGSFMKLYGPTTTEYNVSALPQEVDWVAKGAVTPPKNQGQCGSCWSFSTTGALEGAYAIKWGDLQSFSEQELVSCDNTDKGCNGGWMDSAFDWVRTNGGLATEEDYPYVSGTSGKVPKCDMATAGKQNTKVAPTGFVDVPSKNVAALMTAVVQQPVAIAIEANQPEFQFYKSGVLTGTCGTRLDHGVLLVGYGTYDGVDYWKVKNSWGADWGMNGYILIERSDKDLCGVLDAASYPVLE